MAAGGAEPMDEEEFEEEGEAVELDEFEALAL